MALTVTATEQKTVWGNKRVTTATITGPASYLSPETLVPADFGMTVIDNVVSCGVTNEGQGIHFDKTNTQLTYWNGTTEIADAIDLSGATIEVTVYGR